MNARIFVLIFLISVLVITVEQISASSEPILITHSTGIHNVIFDGKWTNEIEWKQSSHNTFSYADRTTIHLRTAHHENFIYVFVDPITDQTLDDNKDEATVCIDGNNNKNNIPDKDDFCFQASLNQKQGMIFQGSDDGVFKTITNEKFIAISTVSDENDRYTKIPHPSYEFKIPIELFGRSDNYGFYLKVYDDSSETSYLWPKNSTLENFEISSPSQWGDIVSPDKSLPEMNLPILIFTILILTIIFIQAKKSIIFSKHP